MKRIRNTFPLVLILGAFLVIALALVLIYFLDTLEETNHHARLAEPGPVGLEAEPDPDGWRPLFNGHDLEGWEVTNFGPQGPVSVADSSIILTFGDGATGITWTGEFPAIDYEINLEAMRLGGNDFFCGITFPVDREFCTFIVGGWGGSLVGISSIDGKDASENFTTTMRPFENGRWYNIRVQAGNGKLACFIDNEKVVDVPLENHKFSVRSEVGLSIPLGIASWHTTAALRDIRFREL